MYLFSRCSVEQRDSNTECHRILSYLLWYLTMVSVGRGVRSYICTDLLSTREGSPSKGGCKCTPLTPPPPPGSATGKDQQHQASEDCEIINYYTALPLPFLSVPFFEQVWLFLKPPLPTHICKLKFHAKLSIWAGTLYFGTSCLSWK